MDNRVFNVNGSGSEMLLKALQLVFMQEGSHCSCEGWQQSEDKGLVLSWVGDKKDINPFPGKLSAEQCLAFVESWLKSDFAKTVKLSDWCGNQDHDGHNSGGWQVYCEDWGHVGNQIYAICAIKPAFMWHGN